MKSEMKKEVTTDITEIQRIIKDYYTQLYDKNVENLEKIPKNVQSPKTE